MTVSGQFVLGVEHECMTTVDGTDDPSAVRSAVRRLLALLAEEAPSLPSGTGLFNGYGRVYEDCGVHVELASAECESPYLLVSVVERQQRLVARALARLAAEGTRLRLANNNHADLLHARTPCWGSHDNYLCERDPAELTALLLPFLVSRVVYAGAGGVLHPTAEFLHGVRPLFMTCVTEGGTTGNRAIHSTARREHHMGRARRFRYHGLLADGHRSHFGMALTLGATALAIKAAQYDRDLPSALADLERQGAAGDLGPATAWLPLLRRLNRLAAPGRPPAVDPLAIAIQRVYVGAAERYACLLSAPPAWIARLLADWRATLDALEGMDRAWLAARLDAFVKYELFGGFLAAAGSSWAELPGRPDLFQRLALASQDYHTLDHPDSWFERLERGGLLAHRVCEPREPGSEPEPFVPETRTRAAARARFLKENAGNPALTMDWSWVQDCAAERVRTLRDPFAREYAPWRSGGDPADVMGALILERLRRAGR